MQNVSPNNFAKSINQLLDEMDEEITGIVSEAVKEVTSESLEKVRTRAKSYGWKNYPKQIAKSVTRASTSWNRRHPAGTIYVKAPDYRIAHLLENGHALRNGGRARAFPHFKDGADYADTELENRIKEKLR